MNELHDYIIQARASGEQDQDIITALVTQGWSNDAILAAFVELDSNPVASQAPKTSAGEVLNALHVSSSAVQEPQPFSQPTFNQIPSEKPISQRPHKRLFVYFLLLVFCVVSFVIFRSFGNSSKTSTSQIINFAGYILVKKNEPVQLTDSISITFGESQLMSADDFNELQQYSESEKMQNSSQALLIYYSVQNQSDTTQVLLDRDNPANLFSIADTSGKRVDTESQFLLDSLENLASLKPNQYMSDALIFNVPTTLKDTHSLQLLLNFENLHSKKFIFRL